MIQKQKFQSIISKYYLNNIVNSVKWDIVDKQILISFISPNKDMIGEVKAPFPTGNATVAIFNTDQLNKLINITENELKIDFIKHNKTYQKITIYDNKFTVEYSLADLMLIPKVPTVNEPEVYDIIINLSFDNINSYIKAKNALPDADLVIFRNKSFIETKDCVELTIGDQNNFSNKVNFDFDDIQINNSMSFEIKFDANVLKEILNSNKTENATIYLNFEGLMKLEFQDEDILSKYFLIQKETY